MTTFTKVVAPSGLPGVVAQWLAADECLYNVEVYHNFAPGRAVCVAWSEAHQSLVSIAVLDGDVQTANDVEALWDYVQEFQDDHIHATYQAVTALVCMSASQVAHDAYEHMEWDWPILPLADLAVDLIGFAESAERRASASAPVIIAPPDDLDELPF